MKLKNLFLGSVTAAGLMTGAAYAADLGVLSAMDVCDQLGISGLTISSDTNCLKISGEVSYNFSYGVWDTTNTVHTPPTSDVYDMDGTASFQTPSGKIAWGYDDSNGVASILESKVTAKLNFEATADSSFGPAKAIIKLLSENIGNGGGTVSVDEAYVTIGEGTILMAGHKSSVYNTSDDAPLNWLGLFNSETVDVGVNAALMYYDDADATPVDDDWKFHNITGKSNAIQISHDLGNGFSIAGGLEQLDGDGALVGVLAYKGDGISAHVSVAADDVLQDGSPYNWNGYWQMHAGIAATMDTFKFVAAAASDSEGNWNVLGSASATFDMFTIAGSVEAARTESTYWTGGADQTGAGGSITAEVAEGVKLNVGGRWQSFDDDESYEVAVGAEASIAENLTLSGAIGYVSETDYDDTTFTYGWAKLLWAPGGGFTASVKGTVTSLIEDEGANADSDLAYKIETEFKKTFE